MLAGVAAIEGVRTYQTETDLLWHNIRAVAALPGLSPGRRSAAVRPGYAAPNGGDCRSPLFAATRDFAALHAVTGLHWVRLVAEALEDAEPLYRAFWQAIAALVPKIGFPALPSQAALAEMRDTPRAAVAGAFTPRRRRRSDEHDISLTYSAWAEEAVWGDPLYRVVAARRVGLIA